MIIKFTAHSSIKLAKEEIKELIADGTFPNDISGFEELHNYCDANELGGLCDDGLMDTLSDDEFLSIGKTVQAELDKWIKEGMN